MRLTRLSTKLTWGMIILVSVVVVMSTVAIAGGVYFLTEQSIKTSMISNTNRVILNYLSVENGQIIQKQSEDRSSLAAYLRNLDVSAIIVDTEQNVLAKYGVYRDWGSEWIKVKVVNGGKYEDQLVGEYGMFDFYTVPIKFEGQVKGYLQVARKNNEIGIIGRALKIVVSIIFPLAIVMAIVMAYWTARRVARPLQKLSTKLESIEGQSLPLITLTPKMDYEVWVVTRALNNLIERLRIHLARERQITENISHEFKTPLTRIASNLQVGRVEEAEAEVLELGGNVDALLSLSIWEKTNETSDLVPIMKRLIKLVPKRLGVEVIMPKKLVTPLPFSHATVIWRNILDNAIKHNIRNGYIRIVGEIVRDKWSLTVLNSTKIEEPNITMITRRKYKFGQGAGYGIGMSIVDQMCKLHGLKLVVGEAQGEMKVEICGHDHEQINTELETKSSS